MLAGSPTRSPEKRDRYSAFLSLEERALENTQSHSGFIVGILIYCVLKRKYLTVSHYFPQCSDNK